MLWFKWVFLVGVLGVSVHFVLSLCYMCLGLVASSSLTSGLSRLHQSYTAGVVHKLPFERSERGFYGRKQRYTLSLLPSSPLLIMPLVLNSYVHVMGFSRVGSWVLRSTLTDLPSCHSWQILKFFYKKVLITLKPAIIPPLGLIQSHLCVHDRLKATPVVYRWCSP